MLRVTLSVGKFSRSKLTAKTAGNFAVDKIRSKRNLKLFISVMMMTYMLQKQKQRDL